VRESTDAFFTANRKRTTLRRPKVRWNRIDRSGFRQVVTVHGRQDLLHRDEQRVAAQRRRGRYEATVFRSAALWVGYSTRDASSPGPAKERCSQ